MVWDGLIDGYPTVPREPHREATCSWDTALFLIWFTKYCGKTAEGHHTKRSEGSWHSLKVLKGQGGGLGWSPSMVIPQCHVNRTERPLSWDMALFLIWFTKYCGKTTEGHHTKLRERERERMTTRCAIEWFGDLP